MSTDINTINPNIELAAADLPSLPSSQQTRDYFWNIEQQQGLPLYTTIRLSQNTRMRQIQDAAVSGALLDRNNNIRNNLQGIVGEALISRVFELQSASPLGSTLTQVFPQPVNAARQATLPDSINDILDQLQNNNIYDEPDHAVALFGGEFRLGPVRTRIQPRITGLIDTNNDNRVTGQTFDAESVIALTEVTTTNSPRLILQRAQKLGVQGATLRALNIPGAEILPLLIIDRGAYFQLSEAEKARVTDSVHAGGGRVMVVRDLRKISIENVNTIANDLRRINTLRRTQSNEGLPIETQLASLDATALEDQSNSLDADMISADQAWNSIESDQAQTAARSAQEFEAAILSQDSLEESQLNPILSPEHTNQIRAASIGEQIKQLTPEQLLTLNREVNHVIAQRPRQQMGALSDIPDLNNRIINLKTQGDSLKRQILTIEQDLQQTGQRSITNITGYSKKQVNAKVSELDALKSERGGIEREFYRLQEHLKEAIGREDAQVAWDRTPHNQQAMEIASTLNNNSELTSRVNQVMGISAIYQGLEEVLAGENPDLLASVQAQHRSFLQGTSLPSSAQLEAMVDLVQNHQQTQQANTANEQVEIRA